MRIAIINEQWIAGATRCARDLEKGLRARNEVLYFPRGENDTSKTLTASLREFAPDVVHAHSYYGSFPYSLLKDLSQEYAVCFTPHDPRPIGDMEVECWECTKNSSCYRCPLTSRLRRASGIANPYFRSRLHKKKMNQGLHSRTRLISASQWLKRRLSNSELGAFAVEHIPNGIDLQFYRRVDDARAQLGLYSDSKIILYVAYRGSDSPTLNHRKGLSVLATAFTKFIAPKMPNSRLLVAGEHWAPNHPQVIPLGELPAEKLPAYYSAADVLACPSIADNLPYTAIEAMACGTPVVASRIGGIPEIVEENQTGLLVAPSDPVALSDALLKLMGDENLRRQMSLSSRKRAEDHFSLEKFLRRHESVYQLAASPLPR